ncbi:MAG: magnesium transporter CorA family protein [Propioniciclava sp.]|uniref:magnesium transporter CorA family protein n=1 Tax=Propioniciclava sp. TaxID=2038686 RepID=UPI0039E3A83D
MPKNVTVRTWRAGRPTDEPIGRDDFAAAIHDPDMLVWVDLVAPSAEGLASIADELGLPRTAVEDALAPHERAKTIRHESHLFFTVYALSADASALGSTPATDRVVPAASRISGWVLPHALVTIRLDDRFDLDAVAHRWDDEPSLLAHGAPTLVHGLLDAVVDSHFDAIQAVDDRLEQIDDALFAARPAGNAFVRSIYTLRKDLVALRRIVLPMREVMNGLLRHSVTDVAELRPWFDDLYDHILRASEWTESLRDLVTSAFETNLSLQDARLNTIMKKLAGWAAIIAVPTAITGWFGQNLPFPGYDQPAGLWASVALIVVGSTILYLLFRARDWV